MSSPLFRPQLAEDYNHSATMVVTTRRFTSVSVHQADLARSTNSPSSRGDRPFEHCAGQHGADPAAPGARGATDIAMSSSSGSSGLGHPPAGPTAPVSSRATTTPPRAGTRSIPRARTGLPRPVATRRLRVSRRVRPAGCRAGSTTRRRQADQSQAQRSPSSPVSLWRSSVRRKAVPGGRSPPRSSSGPRGRENVAMLQFGFEAGFEGIDVRQGGFRSRQPAPPGCRSRIRSQRSPARSTVVRIASGQVAVPCTRTAGAPSRPLAVGSENSSATAGFRRTLNAFCGNPIEVDQEGAVRPPDAGRPPIGSPLLDTVRNPQAR